MYKIAMLIDNVIQNIAIWDGVSPWTPEGFVLIDITNIPNAIIGSIFDPDSQTFSNP
jgi:hypothetical protein